MRSGTVLIIIGAVLAVLSTAGFYGYSYYIQNQNTKLNAQILDQTKQLASLDSVRADLDTYNNLNSNLTKLFSAQVDWRTALTAMEQVLYRNMKINSYQVTDAGAVTLMGETTSFQEYSRFNALMRDSTMRDYYSGYKVASLARSLSQASGSAPVTTSINFTVHFNLGTVIMKAADNRGKASVIQSLIDKGTVGNIAALQKEKAKYILLAANAELAQAQKYLSIYTNEENTYKAKGVDNVSPYRDRILEIDNALIKPLNARIASLNEEITAANAILK
jgi:hypothetical protein